MRKCKLKFWILFLHTNYRAKQNYTQNALYLFLSWSLILEARLKTLFQYFIIRIWIKQSHVASFILSYMVFFFYKK